MLPPFAHYIANVARVTPNPRGVFIVEARREIAAGQFPLAREWPAIRDHLAGRDAATIYAARRAWGEYRAWLVCFNRDARRRYVARLSAHAALARRRSAQPRRFGDRSSGR
jgi:hypothetical protein